MLMWEEPVNHSCPEAPQEAVAQRNTPQLAGQSLMFCMTDIIKSEH